MSFSSQVLTVAKAKLAINAALERFWEESFRFIVQSILDGFNPGLLPTGFGFEEPIISGTGIWKNPTGGWGSYDSNTLIFLLKDLFFCDSLCSGIWIDHGLTRKGKRDRVLSRPAGPYVAPRKFGEDRINLQKILEDELLLATLSQENRRRRGLWKPRKGKTVPEYRRKGAQA